MSLDQLQIVPLDVSIIFIGFKGPQKSYEHQHNYTMLWQLWLWIFAACLSLFNLRWLKYHV